MRTARGATVLLAFAAAVGLARGQGTLCLLPVGDSITQAATGKTTWRYPLWKRLVDHGVEALFAGSMVNHYGESPGTQEQQDPYRGRAFPPHHEGHAGWRTDEVLRKIDQWMETYACAPTCVLIHLGTIDMCQGDTAGSTIAELEELIGKLVGRFQTNVSNMTFLVAEPIPSCCSQVGFRLSPAIKSHYWSSDASGVKVETVDMVSGFDRNCFLYDGCHPNAAGDDFMAERWFGSVAQHCVEMVTSISTSATPPVAITCAASAASIHWSGGLAAVCFVAALNSITRANNA
ncbi:unnamed protein product [Polarella glacialis]|uniref:SGNH hydrolase-type esterase domain-containing protein n=1 Tax=Polarella glacialis TaxID=89957 RepID=A0A813K3S8_POLGL|nr:unnamed protein product [Polarella glacialis]|mmetsp:Transcript_30901/g.55308  ORF Transcript_30901/g.55308 Transcript_30901/m.55308 type:complete len:290 (+) Transcript_30901:64-933(+)